MYFLNKNINMINYFILMDVNLRTTVFCFFFILCSIYKHLSRSRGIPGRKYSYYCHIIFWPLTPFRHKFREDLDTLFFSFVRVLPLRTYTPDQRRACLRALCQNPKLFAVMYEFSVLKPVYLGDVWGWLGSYLDNGKVSGLNPSEGFTRIRDKKHILQHN